MMRIAVVTSSPPMVEGGHMVIARALVQALREAGHHADIIVTPQNRFGRQASAYLATWLTDVGTSDGEPIDQVISLRYPSYAVRHPESRVLAESHDARVLRPVGPVQRDAERRRPRSRSASGGALIHAADRYLLTQNVDRLFVQSRDDPAAAGDVAGAASRPCCIRLRRSGRIAATSTATTSSWCRG